MNEVINYMKTNNIEQFKKNFNKMQEGGNKSSFNLWTSCVKTRLPKDFSITKSEIMSEVVNQCMYLSDKFDEKKKNQKTDIESIKRKSHEEGIS